MLAKVMGAKKVKIDNFKPTIPSEREIKKHDPNYIPTVEEALIAFGGKGVILDKK